MAQRRPRIQRSGYLAWIRDLPCVICGTDQDIEAAHIRYSSHAAGKQITGAANKPHDCWTLPLCAQHHQWGPDAQHLSNFSERDWWRHHGIDPLHVAALLWLHHSNGDEEGARQVIQYATRLGT